MQHQLPDRVPVMCQLALGHYFLNTEIPSYKIWFTSEGFAEALVSLQRRYRFDGILVNLPGRPEYLLDEVASIEENKEGQTLIWRNGDRTFFPRDDNPQHTVVDRNRLTRADFATLDPDHLEQLDDFIGYVQEYLSCPLD